jgi:hypothetical protein
LAFDFQQILQGFGLSSESVERVKLSRGVVGRTTYAIVAFFAVLAIAASRIATELLLWVIGIGAVTFVIYLFAVMRFADKNPGAALLEGAELLHWQQTELAAKGIEPQHTTPILPPPPRQLEGDEDS